MRILFMGTPDFACFTLKALLDGGREVVGVVTQPDKPKGRGYELQPSPVKVLATERGIPVYQPTTLRDGAFDAELAALAPDVIVVVAYGKILPPSVLQYPRFGCVNVHGSLLPQYRGAAPMQRAVMEGCSEIGVTTMLMNEGLDTGDMLLECRLPLAADADFEWVHDTLGAAGASLLLDTLDALAKGSVTPRPQEEALATYAAKITKADCAVDFTKSATEIHNQVRGLSPVPLAFTRTPDGRMLKIVKTVVLKAEGTFGAAGEVVSLDGGVIAVACGSGTLGILRVLPEGKGRMDADAYIRGRRLFVGDVLS